MESAGAGACSTWAECEDAAGESPGQEVSSGSAAGRSGGVGFRVVEVMELTRTKGEQDVYCSVSHSGQKEHLKISTGKLLTKLQSVHTVDATQP